MTAYDRWLEQPYQEAAERDDAIDEMAEALMKDECNPQDVDVFLEALANECLEKIQPKLAEALKSGHEALGRVIADAVYEYCANQADNLAAERYNQHGRHDD